MQKAGELISVEVLKIQR